MFVVRRIYEAGEDHLADLVLDLRDEWPAGTSFPIELTGEEGQDQASRQGDRIRRNAFDSIKGADGRAVAGAYTTRNLR